MPNVYKTKEINSKNEVPEAPKYLEEFLKLSVELGLHPSAAWFGIFGRKMLSIICIALFISDCVHNLRVPAYINKLDGEETGYYFNAFLTFFTTLMRTVYVFHFQLPWKNCDKLWKILKSEELKDSLCFEKTFFLLPLSSGISLILSILITIMELNLSSTIPWGLYELLMTFCTQLVGNLCHHIMLTVILALYHVADQAKLTVEQIPELKHCSQSEYKNYLPEVIVGFAVFVYMLLLAMEGEWAEVTLHAIAAAKLIPIFYFSVKISSVSKSAEKWLTLTKRKAS